jgi:preprotein translocase subunit YajC
MAHWSLMRFVASLPVRCRFNAHFETKYGKIAVVMNQLVVFLPLLVVMGAFMFFALRRQKRAMQATIDLHESLSVGDRVHTTSGLQATITHITDDTVDLEIAPGVVTTWMKLAIRDRIEPETPDVEEADDLSGETAETPDPDSDSDALTVGDSERLPKD